MPKVSQTARVLIVFSFLLLSPACGRSEAEPALPAPFATKSEPKDAKVLGWPAGKTPTAAPGFEVSSLLELRSPRALTLLPSGDVLVTQVDRFSSDSPNQLTLLRFDGTRLLESLVIAKGLNLPFGAAVGNGNLYVAEAHRIVRYPFDGTKVIGEAVEIATLPYLAPHRHWTRDLLLSLSGEKLYVTVGSIADSSQKTDPRHPETAAILEMNADGSGRREYATGLYNPISMDWEPSTKQLWATVNEREDLGEGLVPDFLAQVKENGYYGWPATYWGSRKDPLYKGPAVRKTGLKPDFGLGSHAGSHGLTFTKGKAVPSPFASGALVARHGSWASSKLNGFDVLYVPFRSGRPSGKERTFLGGFLASKEDGTAYGRPVDTVVLKDGSVLVSDDAGNRLWHVRKKR